MLIESVLWYFSLVKKVIIFLYRALPYFLTAVAPFPGATTGTGGRIRDVQAAGRGAHVVAGTAGYCFGNLNIPGKYKNLSLFNFICLI